MREELEIMQGKKKDHRVGLVVDGYCVTRGRRGSSWNVHAVYGSSMASSPGIRRPRYRTIDGSPSTDGWLASLSTTKSSGSLRSIGTKTSPNSLPFSLSSWKEKPAPSMSHPIQNRKQRKMVQIDTSLFAYEPVLKAIQDIKNMPLTDELTFCRWLPL